MCLFFFHINNQEDKDTTYFKKGNIEESASSYTLQTDLTDFKNDVLSFWPKVMIISFKLTRCRILYNSTKRYKIKFLQTWRIPLQILWGIEAGRPESPIPGKRIKWENWERLVVFIPTPTPKGLARLNNKLDKMNAFTFWYFILGMNLGQDETKKLTEKLLWAILRPRLKAIMALCIMTATKIVSMFSLLFCRPMARP